MSTETVRYPGYMANAFNYAVGRWDALRYRRPEANEASRYALQIGVAVLERYPVLHQLAARCDPPLTGVQLAERIATAAFASSQPNYWPKPEA